MEFLPDLTRVERQFEKPGRPEEQGSRKVIGWDDRESLEREEWINADKCQLKFINFFMVIKDELTFRGQRYPPHH